MADSWLGLDVGGTLTKWEHVGEDGERLASGQLPTPTEGHVQVAGALVTVCANRKGVLPGLRGVGVALPGHLTPERDSVTLLPNVAGQWRGFPLRSYLAAASGITPVLLNDARAFAVAELASGAARGSEDVVFATLGTGVGGAVATRGAVVTNRRDSLGELGHITAVPGGDPCTCGSAGCVEAYAGGTAVLGRARRRGIAVRSGPDALPSLARRADVEPAVAALLDQAYEAFALGVASACAVAGASLVVVGGAVAEELPGYAARCRERLADRVGLLGPVEVRPGQLGPRAGALGAALSARAADRAAGSPTELVLQP